MEAVIFIDLPAGAQRPHGLLLGSDEGAGRGVAASRPAVERIGRHPFEHALVRRFAIVDGIVAVSLSNEGELNQQRRLFFRVFIQYQNRIERVHPIAVDERICVLIAHPGRAQVLKRIDGIGKSVVDLIAGLLEGYFFGICQATGAGRGLTVLLSNEMEPQFKLVGLQAAVESGERAEELLIGIVEFNNDAAILGDQDLVGKGDLAPIVVDDVVLVDAPNQQAAIQPNALGTRIK
jgi:hypothetical protein